MWMYPLLTTLALLSPLAARVNEMTLVLGYERFDDSLIPDDRFVPRYFEAALAKLKDKGVVVKDWKLDAKNREVRIRLDNRGGVKLADIKAAFPSKESDPFPLVTFAMK